MEFHRATGERLLLKKSLKTGRERLMDPLEDSLEVMNIHHIHPIKGHYKLEK